MPLPLLAAFATNIGTVVGYNRANFLYNSGQKVQRAYTGINYQLQLFNLYRQDVRDLVGLTSTKMSNYHVVACLELGMVCLMFGPARLPAQVPSWVLWYQLICLAAAMVFLVASMWLATRAVVVAGSFNVRLQTQYIRLPVPDDEMLDDALTKAEDFEGQDFNGLLRLPFVRNIWQRVRGGFGAEEAESPKDIEQPAVVRVESPRTAAAPKLNGQPVNHLKLYQVLQRKWMCYDAYARVTMSVGTYWLMMSLAYYEIGWNMVVVEKELPAILAAAMFCSTMVLLVYVDVTLDYKELLMVAFFIFGGPALAIWGVFEAEEGETPWQAGATGLMCLLFTSWLAKVGGIIPGKLELPMRWKGVAYLDIFGPLVNEVHSVLANSSLAHHAQLDQNHHYGKPQRSSSPKHGAEKGVEGPPFRFESPSASPAASPKGPPFRFESPSASPGASPKVVRFAEAMDPAQAKAHLAEVLADLGGNKRQATNKLSDALSKARDAGWDERDKVFKKAEITLERLEVPRQLRRLRRVMLDWRSGEVWHHLHEDQRQLLEVMINDADSMLDRMHKVKGGPSRGFMGLSRFMAHQEAEELGSPSLMREGSLHSSASSVYVPAWTQIQEDNGSLGTTTYWVGSATEPGSATAGEEAPTTARKMTFSTLVEDFDEVMARAGHVDQERAEIGGRFPDFFRHASAAPELQREGSEGLEDFDDFGNDDQQVRDKHGRRRRQGHHPVVAYRAASIGLITVWSFGIVNHILCHRSIQKVLPTDWPPSRFLSAIEDFEEDVASLSSSKSTIGEAHPFAWPARFFTPSRGLLCGGGGLENAHLPKPTATVEITASNGLVLHHLSLAAANGEVSRDSLRTLRCPVDYHDALVSASCSNADHCSAVVVANGSFWGCSDSRDYVETEHTTALLIASQAVQARGFRLWASPPTDTTFSRVFAAREEGGGMFQLKTSNDTLKITGSLPLPKNFQASRWLSLMAPSEDTLMAVAEPGPFLLSWDLANGVVHEPRPLSPLTSEAPSASAASAVAAGLNTAAPATTAASAAEATTAAAAATSAPSSSSSLSPRASRRASGRRLLGPRPTPPQWCATSEGEVGVLEEQTAASAAETLSREWLLRWTRL